MMTYEKKEILEMTEEIRKAIYAKADVTNDSMEIKKQRVKAMELLENIEDYIILGCRMP